MNVLVGLPSDMLKEAAETIRIEDGSGRVQFADSLRPTVDASGALEFQIGVIAVPIRWDSAPGVRLELDIAPGDYPPQPRDARFFVLRGTRLVPVTPWCGSAVGPEPGNLIEFEAWLGCFGVHIPARVHVDRREGGVELAVARDEPSGHLAILVPDTLEHRYFMDENGQEVRDPDARFRVKLFHAVIGEEADVVTLTPSTPMAVGHLYAETDLKTYKYWSGKEYLGLSVNIKRLEITIGARHGFIEPQDFNQVGLYED